MPNHTIKLWSRESFFESAHFRELMAEWNTALPDDFRVTSVVDGALQPVREVDRIGASEIEFLRLQDSAYGTVYLKLRKGEGTYLAIRDRSSNPGIGDGFVSSLKLGGLPLDMVEEAGEKIFRLLSDSGLFSYGAVYSQRSFDEKHLFVHEGLLGGVAETTVGVWPEQNELCGVYWLTFFEDELRTSPGLRLEDVESAEKVERTSHGTIIKAYARPSMSGTEEGEARERAIVREIGESHFYLRENVDVEELERNSKRL